MMTTTENFDCVEFQRKVRLKHYEECNGDYNLMIVKEKERLENNKLWLRLLERKEKAKLLKV